MDESERRILALKYKRKWKLYKELVEYLERDFAALMDAQEYMAVAHVTCDNIVSSNTCLTQSLNAITQLYDEYIVSGLTECTDFSEISLSTNHLSEGALNYQSAFGSLGSQIDNMKRDLASEIKNNMLERDNYQSLYFDLTGIIL